MANKRVYHVCKRCLYHAPDKASMRAHLGRVNPCSVSPDGGVDIDVKVLYEELGDIRQKNKTTTCEFCNKEYGSASTLCRHRKTCKVRFGAPKPVPAATQHVLHNTSEPQEVMHMIKTAVREVMEEMKPIQSQTVNIAGDLNNNVVVINAHGNENINYLQPEFLTKCIMDMTNKGLPKLIENVHLNPEHPENHNIRGKSMRQVLLETYDGKRWSLTPANSVLDDLIQKGCKVLYRHFNDHRESQFENEHLQAIIDQNMRELTDLTKTRKSETYYKIRRHLFFMFFQDKPDEFILVADPEGQDLVESTLNAHVD